ncbi:hypothetical protein GCM10008927_25880 [Amylibacter ulvae]|uniref:Exopolysaccharide biosynthesis protein YbjH n=1 Tax=Paramylibacter ulvae TaxID=1651968 RepID=A0ABQ3D6C0_9RHOB|nr:YjbH domain-containing protein [Amylibacter ulvae]GHA59020.1 hypothetical protein GCM10008927_25880 [Amylibacter ulvae]
MRRFITKSFPSLSHFATMFAALTIAPMASAQSGAPVTLNNYGNAGLIDMPSGQSMPEGTISATSSLFNKSLRNTATFQITPRLAGSFRYSFVPDFIPGVGSYVRPEYYDRSFDLRYQLMFEGEYRPAVAIGLQDFAGTGIFSGEYIAATKTLRPNLRVTAGLGWGRLGSYNSFSNPFGADTRPSTLSTDEISGRPQADVWFRGPAAAFAGVEWAPQAVRGLVLKAEYSSDDYANENAANVGYFEHKTPLNFAAEYHFKSGSTLAMNVIGGTEVGLRFSTSIDPRKPRAIGREEAPLPIRVRNGQFDQRRAIFGDVIDGQSAQAGYTDAIPAAEITQSPSGVRIARIRDNCGPAMARELDAQAGVVDLVIFENNAGGANCTVVLRDAGATYVQALSKPAIANGASFDHDANQAAISKLNALMKTDAITVEALSVNAGRAHLRIRNDRFDAPAQAIGRAARAMTHVMPDSVSEFEITVLEQGLPVSTTRLQRRDLEQLQFDSDGAWKSYVRAQIEPSDVGQGDLTFADGYYPKFSAGFAPYIATSLFDPDNPVRVDLRLRGYAHLDIAPGLSLNGSVSKRIYGNIHHTTRDSDSVLPRVRTDLNKYQAQSDPTIDRLTADYLFKLSPDIYGRVTAGILEPMYGGLSAEILYKPVASDFAVGAEINWVKQREFDQLLSFRDYETVTGHASVYWNMGNGFQSQLDVGRYLARDWGGTLSVDRVFKNGWRVGGYFTLTDVGFDDFGEGSFDKGLRATIPLSWFTGQPHRNKYNLLIQPIVRDGGARVNVPNRLYPIVSGVDRTELRNSWGRFAR